VVSEIVADEAESVPQVGARYNVFREDMVTNEPDQYTKDILAEMPKTEGRYLSVKKILDTSA
jgi:Asp-tRNA(Asn)/Glu-tRNA(Gln) amidotransferase C subunit